MALTEMQLRDVERAYVILGVPYSASAVAIKQAYRRIAKRWHPDLYANGTPAHAEATFMMRLINHAYTTIETAPLRRGFQPESRGQGSSGIPAASIPVVPRRRSRRRKRWLELSIRFLCGAVFGLFLALPLLLDLYSQGLTLVLFSAGVVLISGFVSSRFGNGFWHALLR